MIALLPQFVSAQITGTPPPVQTVTAPKTVTPANPDPRVFEIVLPVRIGERAVGSIPVRSTADRLLGVNAHRLANVLEGQVSEETLVRLRALEPGIVPLDALDESGLTLAFDAQALAVRVTMAKTAQPTRVLDLDEAARYAGYVLTDPATIAAGIDADLVMGRTIGREGATGAALFLNGFANIGGYDGLYVDAAGSLDLTRGDGKTALRRDHLTFFKDDTDKAVRYSAIDIRPALPSLAGNSALLGVGIERRFDEIDPDRRTRSAVGRSVLLERTALVEVVVNDIVVRRFTAGPGQVDLRDVPFVDTGNRVEIVVEDELGRRTVDAFSFSSDENLLAPGISEFGVSAGFLQSNADEDGEWQKDHPVATAHYRLGVTPDLTLGAFGTGAEGFAGIGTNLVAAVPFGILRIDGALAFGDDAGGGAARLSYTADLDTRIATGHQFDFRFSFVGKDYRTLDQLDDHTTRRDRIDLDATYRMPLGDRTSLTLAAGYAAEKEEQLRLGFGISHRFDRFVASMLMQQDFRETGRDETALFASLSLPLGKDHRLRASHSTRGNRSLVEIENQPAERIGSLGYRARAERGDAGVSLSGNANYTGNRFLLSGSLARGAGDAADETFGTLRFGSGIAFADGRFGIGRRVSDGFVLAARHATLSEANLTIDASRRDASLARSDFLGPAVAPVARRYGVSEYAVSIADAPLGYDIGQGSYAMRGGALSGFSVVVGSDAYRSVRGIVQDAQGEPVALSAGYVARLDGTGKNIDLFTNRAGRFAATGLSPGRHVLDLDGLRGTFDVVDGKTAFSDLGILTID